MLPSRHDQSAAAVNHPVPCRSAASQNYIGEKIKLLIGERDVAPGATPPRRILADASVRAESSSRSDMIQIVLNSLQPATTITPNPSAALARSSFLSSAAGHPHTQCSPARWRPDGPR